MIKAGTSSNHTVSHSDFFMTIADIIGATVPDNAGEDSVSNFSLRKGEDGGLKMDYVRNIETYKKVFRPTELYNLKEDISEEENVIKDYPDIVKDLKERLESYIKKGRSTEGINQKNKQICRQETGSKLPLWMIMKTISKI